jgi:hypothetical protein
MEEYEREKYKCRRQKKIMEEETREKKTEDEVIEET